MIAKSEIYLALQAIFDGLFAEPTKVTPELSAKEVAGWDSIAQIRLIMALEKRLQIRFDLGEVEQAPHLGALVVLIEKHLAAKIESGHRQN